MLTDRPGYLHAVAKFALLEAFGGRSAVEAVYLAPAYSEEPSQANARVGLHDDVAAAAAQRGFAEAGAAAAVAEGETTGADVADPRQIPG